MVAVTYFVKIGFDSCSISVTITSWFAMSFLKNRKRQLFPLISLS